MTQWSMAAEEHLFQNVYQIKDVIIKNKKMVEI